MKIYDMHVHSYGEKANAEKMLAEMARAGVSGCCLISNRPVEDNAQLGTSFEERLDEVLSVARGHEDKIFPVLWIHPFEENIIEKVHIATDAGIVAFKMICTNYYVYDERCMAVLREIAALGKPIIFHSGILWDGEATSEYNRPLHWEKLIDIDGIRFSMGHCSWPWIDECVALYGKFLNALNEGKNVEMFFDTTPGTPEIYRRELFTKLYQSGYDTGDNVMFGTDGTATAYRDTWTKQWLDIDGKILDELGISRTNREKYYSGNLLRFLGKSDVVIRKEAPIPDDIKPWDPTEPSVNEIIRRWYGKLEFPQAYDASFERAIASIKVSDAISVERYDKNSQCGARNLLSYLYMCEETARRYAERGIPEDILVATLKDIVIWTTEWTNIKGELHLGELTWLSGHVSARLFRLGRLQFCMAGAECDIPEYNVKKGDNIIEVHIPKGDKLTADAVGDSVKRAKEFFARYFPEYKYACFTCHSWLLDEKLKEYLSPDSNIVKFGDMFDRIAQYDSNALLRYLCRWDTNELNLPYAVCPTPFAEKIKAAVLKGEQFHETLGVLKNV